jgi:hypothetical protein
VKDRIQGNWAMAVVGSGDVAGRKQNNQIEATAAAVGTVGMVMDSGEPQETKKVLAKYICSTDTIFWNWLTMFCYVIPNYCLNKSILLYHFLLILSIIMYKIYN